MGSKMKNWLITASLILGCVCVGRCDDPLTSTNTFFVTTDTIKSVFLIKEKPPMDILIQGDNDVLIMKIDKDGDIFLRGKWIGKDKRLVHVFDYWK